MGKRLTGIYIFLVLVSLFSVSASVGQQPRGRGPRTPAVPKPDLKITYRTNTGGQSMESTTMLKGARERSEMRTANMAIVTVVQCDLKRTIQLSENARKYVVTPFEQAGASSAPVASSAESTGPVEPALRGGVITYTTTSVDTGERKEMFGFTAKHIKSSTVTESSPDACNPLKQRTERDGWYIDFSYGLDCNQGGGSAQSYPSAVGGCRDRIQFKQIGTARTGYPLMETTTMYGADGKAMFTSTKEVVELSREPLDAALFDVPDGYTETQNSQELYVAPATIGVTGAEMTGSETSVVDRNDVTSSAAETKQPGKLRVGVVTINNKSDRAISLEALRQRLVNGIQGAGIDAVPLDATAPAAAEAQARARQCDFILFTDISSLKLSAAKKLGGILGRATGVSGVDKSDARVDFSLFAVGETSPRLQSSVNGRAR